MLLFVGMKYCQQLLVTQGPLISVTFYFKTYYF